VWPPGPTKETRRTLRRNERWWNDALPEILRDDALWAYSIRASDQLRGLDTEKVHDLVLMRLLDMGVRDWQGAEDHLFNFTSDDLHQQGVRALCHSTLVGSRLLPRVLDLEDRVSGIFGNWFRVSLICRC
jgi:hypothetical protein